MIELSDYEKHALEEIEAHKNALATRAARQVLPQGMRDSLTTRGAAIRERASQVPGFDKAASKAQAGYLNAARGLGGTLSKGASLSLSQDRVLAAYRRRGVPVDSLEQIHGLDLRVVEKQARSRYLGMNYRLVAGAEGAAAGLVITGGEVLAGLGGGAGGAAGSAVPGPGTVAGAGAGAAPGVGTVAGVMAFDSAAVLTICTRIVAHTALYYGYDPDEPAESVFMMGVLNLGSATTQAGKFAAYAELSRLTQQLVRNATWATLNKSALSRLINRFAQAFGVRLTKAKLGQLVPVVGIAAGAGLNMWLVTQVSDAAYWTYRERFINDKRGVTTMYVPPPPDGSVGEPEEGNIDVLRMLEMEAPPPPREDVDPLAPQHGESAN